MEGFRSKSSSFSFEECESSISCGIYILCSEVREALRLLWFGLFLPLKKSGMCAWFVECVGLLWPNTQNTLWVSTILRIIQIGRSGGISPDAPSTLVKIQRHELPTSRPLMWIFMPRDRSFTVLHVFMIIFRISKPYPVTRRLLLSAHWLAGKVVNKIAALTDFWLRKFDGLSRWEVCILPHVLACLAWLCEVLVDYHPPNKDLDWRLYHLLLIILVI